MTHAPTALARRCGFCWVQSLAFFAAVVVTGLVVRAAARRMGGWS
jgi:hypothetical protein